MWRNMCWLDILPTWVGTKEKLLFLRASVRPASFLKDDAEEEEERTR